MKVHYKQGFAITFIALGSVLLLMNLLLLPDGNPSHIMQIFLSLLFMFIGIMYLTKPCFELRSNELALFNPLGMVVKRYPFENRSDVQIIAGKITVNSNGKSQKVRINKGMLRTSDWNAVVNEIEGGDLTTELRD